MLGLSTGNAAIILRSRLKVQVFKENWEKKDSSDEKNVILTNGSEEGGRPAMQYQVSPLTDGGPGSECSGSVMA